MKAFVIYLPEAPKKAIAVDGIVDQLKKYGLDARAFEGTDGYQAQTLVQQQNLKLWPYSVKGRRLDAQDRDWNKLSRPGVIGCFLSHYRLWQQCAELGEPIAIFEDDVRLYRGWQPVDWKDILILSLGKKSYLQTPWRDYLETPSGEPRSVDWNNRSMPGTSGYAIRPAMAKKLVNVYQGHWTASDNAINTDIGCIQISTHLMGRHTTHQEGNVSLTKRTW